MQPWRQQADLEDEQALFTNKAANHSKTDIISLL